MSEEINNCIQCIRKAECFKYLTEDELRQIDETKSTVIYKKGETIIKQGTEFTHVISFNQGLAKLNIELEVNKNIIIGIIQPSEILGGPGMFVNNRYSFSVKALTESKICLINVDIFKKMIRTNEQFSEKFFSSFSSRYVDAINRLVSITSKQMHGRVAEALLFFSDQVYYSDKFVILLSRQELAEFTGMSKESISRILKDLNQEDIIISNGRNIEIRNRQKLLRLKETG
jgi:CRP/FNR family transcriptional regulator